MELKIFAIFYCSNIKDKPYEYTYILESQNFNALFEFLPTNIKIQ